jgi:hypothetical protein
MCTSIVVNQKKTIVGFNFDNPGWKYHIVTKNKAFYISLLSITGFGNLALAAMPAEISLIFRR